MISSIAMSLLDSPFGGGPTFLLWVQVADFKPRRLGEHETGYKCVYIYILVYV